MILNYQEDMEVVATAADGVEAYKSVRTSTRCFNIRFEHATRRVGLIATSKISESFPETKILILTMFDDEEYLFHVLKVVLKDTF